MSFGGSKQYFQTYYLTSAAHNARIAGEAEEALKENNMNRDAIYKGESFRRWQPIHDSHIMSSIISSYTAIEVGINEYIEEKTSFLGYVDDQVSKDTEPRILNELIYTFPNDFYRLPTLGKYQIVLLLSEGSRFNKGKEPFQNVDLIRRMRNEFVQYKPKWLEVNEESSPDHSLGRALQTKDFDLNPFREKAPFFPNMCLSYGCARWVFFSTLNFLDDFYKRVSTKSGYSSWEKQLKKEIDTDWKDQDPQW